MRIAEVAPLAESVPPKVYGGTDGWSPGLPKNWWVWIATSLCLPVPIPAPAPPSSVRVHVPYGSVAQYLTHGPLTRLASTRLRTGQGLSM
jgi:hypothetical protein